MRKVIITVEAYISDEEAEMFHDDSTLVEQAEIVKDILRNTNDIVTWKLNTPWKNLMSLVK